MIRLFYAYWPREAGRDVLMPTVEAVNGGRRAFRNNLHLTLRFLGEVSEALIPQLEAPLDLPWPRLTVSNWFVGSFKRAGALWLSGDLSPGPEAVTQVLPRMEETLQALGLPPDPLAWKPHLTIARGWSGPVPGLPVPQVPLTLDQVALVESRPHPAGVQYIPLKIRDL